MWVTIGAADGSVATAGHVRFVMGMGGGTWWKLGLFHMSSSVEVFLSPSRFAPIGPRCAPIAVGSQPTNDLCRYGGGGGGKRRWANERGERGERGVSE